MSGTGSLANGIAAPAGAHKGAAADAAAPAQSQPLVPLPVETVPPPKPTTPTTITDFLTDGSLAALCAELSRLTGVPVELRDPVGRLIVGGGEPGPGNWKVIDTGEAPPQESATCIPLSLGGRAIGWLMLGDGQPALATDARERLEHALSLLARTTTELCQHEVELRHRVKEVAALTRMSSLLVRAAGPDNVLGVALESALDVLELDAGSIVLLAEDSDGVTGESESDLVLKASRGLSQDWLTSPLPLSKDRVFDRQALAGELVIVEDIAHDPRILIPDRAEAEGLRAAIHVGMVFRGRPMGVIRLYSRRPRGFDESERRLLRSLAEQAAAALEQSRLMKFEQEEQRVQRQLQLAADVQRRMLPRKVPSIPALDMAARYTPSFELGGDFYDFIDLNGHLGVVVGDVVGKGIAAALLMSSVRASLRAHVQEVYDLDEVVARVNAALCQDTRDNEFASLWYGVIDPRSLRMTYCSAGHEPPLVLRQPRNRPAAPGDITELHVGGMVVGIDPAQTYQRAVYDLRPGDFVIAYTDGLVDAVNFAGQRFGKARVRQAVLNAVREIKDCTAAQMIDRVLWEVRQFAGLAPRPDDLTLLAVRVN
ncbi:MAG TPA: GAF domain-containing SpoIIE family protein phosphatase [Phycisphaerales bacterium]|nr:GAF domain-containing SpoIIE family protein phosphatase [Phycisphaerales bacterium]